MGDGADAVDGDQRRELGPRGELGERIGVAGEGRRTEPELGGEGEGGAHTAIMTTSHISF